MQIYIIKKRVKSLLVNKRILGFSILNPNNRRVWVCPLFPP
jgi:hypothetical protein